MPIERRDAAAQADAIDRALKPRGVAVIIEASHECVSSRGVRKG